MRQWVALWNSGLFYEILIDFSSSVSPHIGSRGSLSSVLRFSALASGTDDPSPNFTPPLSLMWLIFTLPQAICWFPPNVWPGPISTSVCIQSNIPLWAWGVICLDSTGYLCRLSSGGKSTKVQNVVSLSLYRNSQWTCNMLSYQEMALPGNLDSQETVCCKKAKNNWGDIIMRSTCRGEQSQIYSPEQT